MIDHVVVSTDCNEMHQHSLKKGVLDIGSGNPIKIRNLAPGAPIRLNTPSERTFTCANTEKMKSLGFKPKYNIENYLTNADKGIILNITNGEHT